MEGLKVISVSPSAFCDICHKSDCFDASRDYCSRCSDVESDLYMIAPRKSHSFNTGDTGIVLGILFGAVIGGIGESIRGLSFTSLSTYQVIIGIALFGAILGAIAGQGVERLRGTDRKYSA